MTDYKIENTNINDEENFRAWEKLVMNYEPVRRNLYEIYCKSLDKENNHLPEPEPEKTLVEDESDFSSDEEEEEETQQPADRLTQEEVNDFTKKYNEKYIYFSEHNFFLKIPKMNINLRLYHYKTTNNQVSFRFNCAEFSQDLVVTKNREFWTNIIEGNPNFNAKFQFNKKQKEIFLAAYPYDKKRLPNMFITNIKD